MKDSQKIELKLSEARSGLNALIEKRNQTKGDAPADLIEGMSKASTEIQNLEVEFRAARIKEDAEEKKAAQDNPDSQAIELRSMIQKASIVPFLNEAIKGNEIREGVEHELRQAILGDEARQGLVPFEIFLPRDDAEERADVATPVAASAKTPGSQASILERVFSRSIAARLLVDMPMVETGTANFPVLKTGVSASMAAEDAAVEATAGTFEGFSLEPVRLQARYLFSRESEHKLAGLEDAFRRDLAAVISDAMDAQIVAGNGTPPDVSGFLAELTAPTNPSAVTTFNEFIKYVTDLVDGLNAFESRDIRLVIGKASYGYGATLFQSDPKESALDYITRIAGGLSVSSRITAAASNIQTNLAALTSYPGRNAVAPIWQGVEILRDPYTEAAKGQIALTATMFWNFKIVRETGFALFKTKLA